MSGLEDRLKLLQPEPASEGLRRRVAYPAILGARGALYRLLPLGAAAAALLAILTYSILLGPSRMGTQADAAEETFRRMEDALLKAQTIRVRFRREGWIKYPSGETESVVTSGFLRLKGPNKLHLDFTEKRQADRPNALEVGFVIVSDGQKLKTMVRTKEGLKPAETGPIRPEQLREKFAVALARESIAVPGAILPFTLDALRDQMHPVSGFKRDADEGNARTLTYKEGGWDVRLWYEPKTLLPMKRTWSNKELGSFTESYEEVVLGAEILDELFQLPAEK